MTDYAKIKEGLTLDEGKAKSFSRGAFTELTMAYMNNPHDVVDYNSKGEEVGKHNGAAEMRSTLFTGILKNVGLETEEAKNLANSYVVSKKEAESFYPVVGDLVFDMLETGRAFALPAKEDCQCKFTLHDVEAGEKDKITSLGVYHIKNENYRKIKASSPCPANKKQSESK